MKKETITKQEQKTQINAFIISSDIILNIESMTLYNRLQFIKSQQFKNEDIKIYFYVSLLKNNLIDIDGFFNWYNQFKAINNLKMFFDNINGLNFGGFTSKDIERIQDFKIVFNSDIESLESFINKQLKETTIKDFETGSNFVDYFNGLKETYYNNFGVGFERAIDFNKTIESLKSAKYEKIIQEKRDSLKNDKNAVNISSDITSDILKAIKL